MKGQIISPSLDRDCTCLGVPEWSKLFNHEKRPSYVCTFLPDISCRLCDEATHWITMCTFRPGKGRQRDADTRKTTRQRQEAARKARKTSGPTAPTPKVAEGAPVHDPCSSSGRFKVNLGEWLEGRICDPKASLCMTLAAVRVTGDTENS